MTPTLAKKEREKFPKLAPRLLIKDKTSIKINGAAINSAVYISEYSPIVEEYLSLESL